MARALRSASSEFLQLDDEISKTLDINFTLVGRGTKDQRRDSENNILKARKASSLSVLNEKAPRKSKTANSDSAKSDRELTAIEIWKRHATKFGPDTANKKGKKQIKAKGNLEAQATRVEEMIVGAGTSTFKVIKVPAKGKVDKKLKKKVKKVKSGLEEEGGVSSEVFSGEEVKVPKVKKLKKSSEVKIISNVESFIVKEAPKMNATQPKKRSPMTQHSAPHAKKLGKIKKKNKMPLSDDSESELLGGDEPPNPMQSVAPESDHQDVNMLPRDSGDSEEKVQDGNAEENEEKLAKAGKKSEGKQQQQEPLKIVAPSLKCSTVMDMSQYLARIQAYFDQLGYHREGEPDTKVDTRLSIKHLMTTAKSLIKVGASIKCLHALVMGIYFTNHTPLVERFPIHFKSNMQGKEYKHVVLGFFVQGNFGALGISRDEGLQDKPPAYPRLSELINDYYHAYHKSGHVLKELKIGAVITHDPHSMEHITWKLGKVNFDLPPEQIETEIEKISRKLRSQMGSACLRGVRLDQFNSFYPIQQRPSPQQPQEVLVGSGFKLQPLNSKTITNSQLLQLHIQGMRSRSIPLTIGPPTTHSTLLSRTRSLKKRI